MDIIIEYTPEIMPIFVKVDADLCNCEMEIIIPRRLDNGRTTDIRCGKVVPKRKLELWDHMFGMELGDEM